MPPSAGFLKAWTGFKPMYPLSAHLYHELIPQELVDRGLFNRRDQIQESHSRLLLGPVLKNQLHGHEPFDGVCRLERQGNYSKLAMTMQDGNRRESGVGRAQELPPSPISQKRCNGESEKPSDYFAALPMKWLGRIQEKTMRDWSQQKRDEKHALFKSEANTLHRVYEDGTIALDDFGFVQASRDLLESWGLLLSECRIEHAAVSVCQYIEHSEFEERLLGVIGTDEAIPRAERLAEWLRRSDLFLAYIVRDKHVLSLAQLASGNPPARFDRVQLVGVQGVFEPDTFMEDIVTQFLGVIATMLRRQVHPPPDPSQRLHTSAEPLSEPGQALDTVAEPPPEPERPLGTKVKWALKMLAKDTTWGRQLKEAGRSVFDICTVLAVELKNRWPGVFHEEIETIRHYILRTFEGGTP